nr:hypothetical protein [Methanobrevibacter arboriphilus]
MENSVSKSYLRIRFANSPPPAIIIQFVSFNDSTNFIAFFGKRLPPILITHSMIITPLICKLII